MTIDFSFPFWWIILAMALIGILGFCLIAIFFGGGAFDFVTPILAMGWALIFIVAAIGMALGKYVF